MIQPYNHFAALFFILFVLDMKEPVLIKNTLHTFPVNATFPKPHDQQLVASLSTVNSDKCVDQWTSDKLVGRCFGLKNHGDYPSLKDIPIVPTANHCKNMCCDLNTECVSWQYWVGIKLCKLGGAVRLGVESGATPNWCEPEPPIKWSGRKIVTFNGTRVESDEELTTQCFGLGPQQFRMDGEKRVPLIASECSSACLADPNCNTWQAHEKRGCFYASSHTIYCEPYDGIYEGGRKKIVSGTFSSFTES